MQPNYLQLSTDLAELLEDIDCEFEKTWKGNLVYPTGVTIGTNRYRWDRAYGPVKIVGYLPPIVSTDGTKVKVNWKVEPVREVADVTALLSSSPDGTELLILGWTYYYLENSPYMLGSGDIKNGYYLSTACDWEQWDTLKSK